jgi:hypothetical protein
MLGDRDFKVEQAVFIFRRPSIDNSASEFWLPIWALEHPTDE